MRTKLLIARKFSPELSVQLLPTLIHRNDVATAAEQNDVYALAGLCARKSPSAQPSPPTTTCWRAIRRTFRNALGLGVDIETGGHVFQLHVTNSLGMTEKFFVPETTGNFFAGDLYFGFTVARNFTVHAH